MVTNLQILSDLRLLKDNRQAVDLMNTYKGVPFVSRCRILEIDGDRVTIQTKDFSLVCIQKEKSTRVLGSDFFEPSLAQVAAVDLLNGTAVLYDFSYLGAKLGERMIIRVEPEEPLDVEIASNGSQIAGRMADISLSGIGLLIMNEEYPQSLNRGSKSRCLRSCQTARSALTELC